MSDQAVQKTLELLDDHYLAFATAKHYADETGHTVPCDTKSWSQILVSVLTGLSGRARKKGSDLDDGSDVKAANTWSAIDTPRFNGAIPSGRTTAASRKPPDVSALDDTPYIFFVLWDEMGSEKLPRCRIWVVRPQHDPEFRRICSTWYTQRAQRIIKSDNFQLHPPRNQDHDVIRNSCGNLIYPLFFYAVRKTERFELVTYSPDVLQNGMCRPAD